MTEYKSIGVVGGVGPYAGLDLARKIFDLTDASSDQEHINVSLLSLPSLIADRTAFLLGQSDDNPAFGIIEVIKKLERIGASVVGIPCNSAHAPAIFDIVVQDLNERDSSVKLLNMIRETADFVYNRYPEINHIGLLSTTGTHQTGVYTEALTKKGFCVISPDTEAQAVVHRAIYDADFGVKAQSYPVTEQARRYFLDAIEGLRRKGAEGVILGCTEIPLAVPENEIRGIKLIDPARILAEALIKEVQPDKLTGSV
ncbi:amino acid racemase [bacterium]|nr:amino acid racemase [bacterium]